MRPVPSNRNVEHSRSRNAEFPCQNGSLFALIAASPDLGNLLSVQLSSRAVFGMAMEMISFAKTRSTPLRRLFHIGFLRAWSQMCWIAATWIIAGMEQEQTRWDWANEQFISESMSADNLSAWNRKGAIPTWGLCACPYPARLRSSVLVHFRPESLFQRWSWERSLRELISGTASNAASSVAHRIRDIFSLCAKPKMQWIDAFASMAEMAYDQSLGDRSIHALVDPPMGRPRILALSSTPVAVSIESPRPGPTSIRTTAAIKAGIGQEKVGDVEFGDILSLHHTLLSRCGVAHRVDRESAPVHFAAPILSGSAGNCQS